MLAGLLGPPPRRAAPYARCVAALRAEDVISEGEVSPDELARCFCDAVRWPGDRAPLFAGRERKAEEKEKQRRGV